MVKVTYNNAVIASLEGGNIATLQCAGKKMIDDITVSAPEIENSPLPIEVATEEEMNALLETAGIGDIYKYTGETGVYENGALYVVEEGEVKTYSLTITNSGSDYLTYGVDVAVASEAERINVGETKTIEGVKEFVGVWAPVGFTGTSITSNCTFEEGSYYAEGIIRISGDGASITLYPDN